MSKEHQLKLTKIMKKVFPNSYIPEDLSDLRYGSFEEWDSLGNYALLMLVEDEFGISFTIKELSEIKSIKEILGRIAHNNT